jgi:hypothetical protein
VGHADEVTTDVNVRRIRASESGGVVSIAWDYPGRTLIEVRILRSGAGFADGPEPSADQRVVYEDVTGSFRDPATDRDAARFYTVFARLPSEAWVRWGEFVSQREADVKGVKAAVRLLGKAWGSRITPCLVVAALAALLATGLLMGAAVAAPKSTAATDAQQQAVTTAAADPAVAAVLEAAGGAPTPQTTAWPDGRGVTVTYHWAAGQATRVAAIWPLVKTNDSQVPVAPYTRHDLRLRITALSGLRVDVLNAGPRVVQILPADAATQFDLHEQTWPPFSSIPWFTQRPYVLVPVFLLIAVAVIWRAWLRSRAWNRRLPSMTRHDRQFIGRLAVIIFLVASFAWLVYEGVIAAGLPAADPNAVAAGDLAALPVLLISPGLLIAGLVLELSWQPHRVAWGLLAVLAAAASAYNLAAAVTGTAGNSNLSAYIILAVLALIAIPRAFSLGKMGWSRSFAPRYG